MRMRMRWRRFHSRVLPGFHGRRPAPPCGQGGGGLSPFLEGGGARPPRSPSCSCFPVPAGQSPRGCAPAPPVQSASSVPHTVPPSVPPSVPPALLAPSVPSVPSLSSLLSVPLEPSDPSVPPSVPLVPSVPSVPLPPTALLASSCSTNRQPTSNPPATHRQPPDNPPATHRQPTGNPLATHRQPAGKPAANKQRQPTGYMEAEPSSTEAGSVGAFCKSSAHIQWCPWVVHRWCSPWPYRCCNP